MMEVDLNYAGIHSSFMQINILSPKRNKASIRGWESFFPYYAGYPEVFAEAVLSSAGLGPNSTVLDPWNGSGTTTFAASRLGLRAYGSDLNPVMVVVARARLTPPSQAATLIPLAVKISSLAAEAPISLDFDDPLLEWFDLDLAQSIRCIEHHISLQVIGSGLNCEISRLLEQMPSVAATLYVALFRVCRSLLSAYQSSNPTWLRRPRKGEIKVSAMATDIRELFVRIVSQMAAALVATSRLFPSLASDNAVTISVCDTTEAQFEPASVDLVLTSPPYCTRIDYTVATRIELAVLSRFLSISPRSLARQMIGSTRVPVLEISPSHEWGEVCLSFLAKLKEHPSKASSGYYYKTHLDYFDKIHRSIKNISAALRCGAIAVFVVQDSRYKELHNDLPEIVTNISASAGLKLQRRENFELTRSMAGLHKYARQYARPVGPVEAVLCFCKE